MNSLNYLNRITFSSKQLKFKNQHALCKIKSTLLMTATSAVTGQQLHYKITFQEMCASAGVDFNS